MFVPSKWLLIGAAAAAVALPVAPALAWQPAVPAGVEAPASFQDNGQDGVYLVPLLEGEDPAEVVAGVIQTDTDCAPDEEGLSHCHNAVALEGGAAITIQNTHNMMRFRCLAPGETVSVEPVAPGWVAVRTAPED